ncbi:hypothetical protein QFC22_003850 [Naganishia vaughanmartiniae]|uniref:Uncharacterized protein n=1 Tax=Naganishia vaughanmartiniae TaxID=1424756 RepID=A0ACC2X3M0_9TREE|nr:hypothetical protein QFC22_003850 [Naganishia vaughanmartiniae]
MFASQILASLLLAPLALAHYTLEYPTARGFIDEEEVNFCGGFAQPSSTRTSFPLSGNAPVRWDSHHAIGTVGIYISTSTNPSNWSDFSTTMAKSWFTGPNGAACTNIDMSKLNMNLTNGSLVTIQMVANGGDGNLYQCSDLILLSDYTVPSNETCATDVALAANATATATPSLGQSASAKASSTSGGATSAVASASSSAAASAGQKVGVASMGAWVGMGLALVGAGVAVL